MWTLFAGRRQRSFAQATRRFQAVSIGSSVLRYDPALDPLEIDFFRLACSQQITAIERLFGAQLRPPWWLWPSHLHVYLFPSSVEVSRVYGAPAGGFANFGHWSDNWYIVVNLEADWREILRHELAHIIGGRWNPRAPTVLCEGLAVWAARTHGGCPIDEGARRLLCSRRGAIEHLLGPEPAPGSFDRHRYYVLTGSFTATLIRRFGLRRYRRFYRDRAITLTTLEKRFARHFGVPLRTAADNWLSDLIGEQLRRSAPTFPRWEQRECL